MSDIWRDIRFALRSLRKNPGFAAIVVLSLGLGIGLNTAVFSFVDAVLLHPFPYSQPDRLAFIWGARSFDVRTSMSADRLQGWQKRSHTFEKIAPFQLNLFPIALGADATNTVQAAYVGSDVFSVLGVRPFLGETFSSAQGKSGGEKAVILSYGLWQSRFGGDKNIVGSTIRVNGELYSTKGVMPSSFFFPDQNAQLWIPLTTDEGLDNQVHGLGRLRAGVGIAEAQAELDALAQNDAKENRHDASRISAGVFSIYQVVVGKYELALWTLLGAVTLLVLLGCANVANLLLARGIAREKELAVRVALGAGRGEILRQLLTESLVLALFAGTAGLLAGYWGIRALQTSRLIDIAGLDHASINYRVLFFSLGVSFFAGLISGIVPAWKASRGDLHGAMQQGGAGTSGRKHGELRDLFVSVEAAFALILLVSAGLLVNSFVRLSHSDWGFNSANLLLIDAPFSKSATQTTDQRIAFGNQVLQRLSNMPGVISSAMAYGVPLSYGYKTTRFAVGDQTFSWDAQKWDVSRDYFRTMGVPVLRGREFDLRDVELSARTLIISESFAQKIWGKKDPIGLFVQFRRLKKELRERARKDPRNALPREIMESPASWEPDGAPLQIIGEVGNVRAIGLDIVSDPDIYVNYMQSPGLVGDEKFVVRTSMDARKQLAVISNEILVGNRDATIKQAALMSDLVDQSIGGRGSNKLLLVISILFGSLSLLLAVAGIYGVVSHSASQRTREIGIRVALGAQPRDIAWLLTLQGMRPVMWGVALGLLSTWAVTRFFSALVFGIKPTDPATFISVSVLLILVALGACLVPAIRTMRTNPVESLRYE
jgi:putative ABC transport system permease protein